MKFDFSAITPFTNGKAGFIAGLSQTIGLGKIFDEALSKDYGRPADLSYGSVVQMMLISMADGHQALSKLKEYFENIDLESLLGHPIDRTKLTDDRFGDLLDKMHEYGNGNLLSQVSVAAFRNYGIHIRHINFDTTSKVMWGEYITEDGEEQSINISFGYSKQKRFDKKQIVLTLGVSDGVVVDGSVLSGNTSDKTYNIDNLDKAKEIREKYNSKTDDFFYIADSAAFTNEFLKKAQSLSIDAITRVPDNFLIAKEALTDAFESFDDMDTVEIETSTKPSVYKVRRSITEYNDIPMTLATCYSSKLRDQKSKTINRAVTKEETSTKTMLGKLRKRDFACETDAITEIAKVTKSTVSKLKYHKVTLSVSTTKRRPVGRPRKDYEPSLDETIYNVCGKIMCDESAVNRALLMSSMFVLSCTKLDMQAGDILREYKTQSSVERKFQFLKSPKFVNSLYVESPKRVESLGYLMIMLITLLSVAEQVVRKKLAEDKAIIIGPAQVKMKKPSLMAIYGIFYSVQTAMLTIKKTKERGFTKPLYDNVKTVLKYLGIDESIYIRGDCKA